MPTTKYPGLPTEFGANVRRTREAFGLSQEALAAKAGLAPTYVGQIERADRNPSLKVVERIAKALGKKPWELLQ